MSRQDTPREVAAIAAAWVEYKPVLEGNCKSAPDKKKAWQMFQQKAAVSVHSGTLCMCQKSTTEVDSCLQHNRVKALPVVV